MDRSSFAWLGIILFVGGAHAAPSIPTDLGPLPCKAEILKTLAEAKVTGEWVRFAEPSAGARTYRSPTSSFGTWVEIQRTDRSVASLTQFSPTGIQQHVWDASAPKCKATLQTKKFKPFSAAERQEVFTDEDLAQALATKKKGLIYVWSPSFEFSVQTYPNFKKAAAALGLETIIVMDPQASAPMLAKMEKTYRDVPGGKKNESIELINRGVGVHYPTVLPFVNGKLSNRYLRGAFSTEQYTASIPKAMADAAAQ
jgi:hypothetical protein